MSNLSSDRFIDDYNILDGKHFLKSTYDFFMYRVPWQYQKNEKYQVQTALLKMGYYCVQ